MNVGFFFCCMNALSLLSGIELHFINRKWESCQIKSKSEFHHCIMMMWLTMIDDFDFHKLFSSYFFFLFTKLTLRITICNNFTSSILHVTLSMNSIIISFYCIIDFLFSFNFASFTNVVANITAVRNNDCLSNFFSFFFQLSINQLAFWIWACQWVVTGWMFHREKLKKKMKISLLYLIFMSVRLFYGNLMLFSHKFS